MLGKKREKQSKTQTPRKRRSIKIAKLTLARILDVMAFMLLAGGLLTVYLVFGVSADLYWAAAFGFCLLGLYITRYRLFPGCWFGRKALGIDLGNSQIKIVEIRGGKSPRLLRHIVIPTPPGSVENGSVKDEAKLLEALVPLLKRKKDKLSTRRGASVLTGQNLLFRHIELPPMPVKDVPKAVHFQFEQYFQMRPEDTVTDFKLLTEPQKGEPVPLMLVAMPKDPVMSLVNFLAKVGLSITAIDIEPLAVLRSFRLKNTVSKDENMAIIDFGAGTTNISVFKGLVLQTARVLQLGGNDYTRAIVKELGISWAEAEALKVKHGLEKGSKVADILAPIRSRSFEEISRTLSFYLAEHKGEVLSKVIVMGGNSAMVGLTEQLQLYLLEGLLTGSVAEGFVVDSAKPLSGIQHQLAAAEAAALDPILSVAIGLALGEVNCDEN